VDKIGSAEDTSVTQNYANIGIAEQQRILVDRQLAAMQAGNPPACFQVVGDILARLKTESSLKSLTVLDVGCSSAYYWEVFEQYVPGWVQYTGLDTSVEMIELARTRYPELQVLEGDARDLQFPGDSFDLVFASALIGHVSDWSLALEELARVACRWLLLHRTWLWDGPETKHTFTAYGHDFWYLCLNRGELLSVLDNLGFGLVSECDAGERAPHKSWSVETQLFERL